MRERLLGQDATSGGAPPHEQLVRALGHPLRYQILQILNERTSSPSDLARELGADLGVVAYHVRRLLDAGLIEPVRDEYRRGGLKHLYRAQRRAFLTNEHFAELPASVRRSVFAGLLQRIWRDVGDASEHGGFDAPDAHVSWTPFDLDQQGYADMVRHVDECLDRAIEIQAEVAQRRASGESAADGVKSELVLLHFLRAADVAAAPPVEMAVADAVRTELYALAEDLGEELVAVEPDWRRVDELLDRLKARVRTGLEPSAAAPGDPAVG